MARDESMDSSGGRFGRGARRALWLTLGVAGAVLLIPFVGLLMISRGKPASIVDADGNPAPGSISEKTFVEINGVQQGMFIQSKDPDNPVLLSLHGGPGMPTYFLTEHYPTGLEQYFTVVWWDQRGAGLSNGADLPPETVTAEQIISDTIAVTNYLRERFGQEKIYLMGHSWGSYIGIQAAARAPELYYAYIGVSQVVHQIESERIAYEYMLEQYSAAGDTRMVSKLEAAPITRGEALPLAYDLLRDDAMHRLGIGTTRTMRSVLTGILIPSWLSPQYTVREKVNLWRGKFCSKALLWQTFMADDLSQRVTRLSVPVYFFHGKYDYTVSYDLARAYFDHLSAPRKGFYTFEDSAHSPLLEEPAHMRRIFEEDVFAGATQLADTP